MGRVRTRTPPSFFSFLQDVTLILTVADCGFAGLFPCVMVFLFRLWAEPFQPIERRQNRREKTQKVVSWGCPLVDLGRTRPSET